MLSTADSMLRVLYNQHQPHKFYTKTPMTTLPITFTIFYQFYQIGSPTAVDSNNKSQNTKYFRKSDMILTADNFFFQLQLYNTYHT